MVVLTFIFYLIILSTFFILRGATHINRLLTFELLYRRGPLDVVSEAGKCPGRV